MIVGPTGQCGTPSRGFFKQQPEACRADARKRSDQGGRYDKPDKAFGTLTLVVHRVRGGALPPS